MSVGEDIFPPITASPIRVGLEQVATFTAPDRMRFQELVDAPDPDETLYVVDNVGRVFTFDDTGASEDLFLDLRDRDDFLPLDNRGGLRSIAFHPDSFSEDTAAAGYGRLYTAYTAPLESAPDDVTTFKGQRGIQDPAFAFVVAEWQFDPETRLVDYDSKRELFRVETITTPHVSGKLLFNPAAGPGDDDYGNLYISIGDLSVLLFPDVLNRPNGKFFRIDPTLQPDGAAYGIPSDNPLLDNPNALPEIFLDGTRNPQTLFFDEQGTGQLLFGDVGGNRAEEVNIALAGESYGWPVREGPLVKERQANIYEELPEPLPADDLFQYPITGFDHDAFSPFPDEPVPGVAIALGAVVRGGSVPALDGSIVFSNFPGGQLLIADAASIDAAIADGQVTPDEFVQPAQLTQIEYEGELTTVFSLLGNEGSRRADARFGTDADGNLYIFGKWNGEVYRFIPAESDAAQFAFSLVDTDTDAVIAPLTEGGLITTATLADARGIAAAFGADLGSIQLELLDANGDIIATTVDNDAPYALFDVTADGDFGAPTVPLDAGSYSLTAVAFSGDDATGTELGRTTVAFNLDDAPAAPDFVLSLVDTATDVVLEPINPGARIDPELPPLDRGFVVTAPGLGAVGSIALQLFDKNGALIFDNVADAAPFALFGADAGDFFAAPAAIEDSNYTLTATAYSAAGATGTVLAIETIQFELNDGNFVFSLVDTATDQAVAAMVDGTIVTTDVAPEDRGIVVELLGVNSEESLVLELFDVNGTLLASSTDDVIPYALFGDDAQGDLAAPSFPLVDGTYSLRATGHAEDGGAGPVLAQRTITFDLNNSSADDVLFAVNAGGASVAGYELPADAVVDAAFVDVGPIDFSADAPRSPFVAAGGQRFFFDTFFGEATFASNVDGGPNLADDGVLQTERWSDLRGDTDLLWQFPVAPGSEIAVDLYFAEVFANNAAPGARTFDVNIEGGALELDDFDIFTAAGNQAERAVVKTFETTVGDDGILDILFPSDDVDGVDNPKIAAIVVRQAPSDASAMSDGPMNDGDTFIA